MAYLNPDYPVYSTSHSCHLSLRRQPVHYMLETSCDPAQKVPLLTVFFYASVCHKKWKVFFSSPSHRFGLTEGKRGLAEAAALSCTKQVAGQTPVKEESGKWKLPYTESDPGVPLVPSMAPTLELSNGSHDWDRWE